MILPIFSSNSCRFLFILLIISFGSAEAFSFDVVLLAYLGFVAYAFGFIPKQSLLTVKKLFLPMFSTKSFTVEGLHLNLSSILSKFLQVV